MEFFLEMVFLLVVLAVFGLTGLASHLRKNSRPKGKARFTADGFEYDDGGGEWRLYEWDSLLSATVYSSDEMRLRLKGSSLILDPRAEGMAEFLAVLQGKLGGSFQDAWAARREIFALAESHRSGERAWTARPSPQESAFLRRPPGLETQWRPLRVKLADAFDLFLAAPRASFLTMLVAAGLAGVVGQFLTASLLLYGNLCAGLAALGALSLFYYTPREARFFAHLAFIPLAGFFFYRQAALLRVPTKVWQGRVASKSLFPDLRREGLSSLVPFRVRLDKFPKPMIVSLDTYSRVKPGDMVKARVRACERAAFAWELEIFPAPSAAPGPG